VLYFACYQCRTRQLDKGLEEVWNDRKHCAKPMVVTTSNLIIISLPALDRHLLLHKLIL